MERRQFWLWSSEEIFLWYYRRTWTWWWWWRWSWAIIPLRPNIVISYTGAFLVEITIWVGRSFSLIITVIITLIHAVAMLETLLDVGDWSDVVESQACTLTNSWWNGVWRWGWGCSDGGNQCWSEKGNEELHYYYCQVLYLVSLTSTGQLNWEHNSIEILSKDCMQLLVFVLLMSSVYIMSNFLRLEKLLRLQKLLTPGFTKCKMH